MAFDTTAINAAYLAAIEASTILDTIEKEQAKGLLSRLIAAMITADTAAGTNIQAYSIAGRSVTYKTDGSSFGQNASPNSAPFLQRKLDLLLGRRQVTSYSDMGGTLV